MLLSLRVKLASVMRSFTALSRALLFPEKAALDARIKKEFDEAKRLSDFVGMLTRLVFLGVAVRFFYNDWWDATDKLGRWNAMVAFVITIIFAFYFGLKVTSMIMDYCISDVTVFESRFMKTLALIVGLYVYSAIVTEAYKGVYALAHATKLSP